MNFRASNRRVYLGKVLSSCFILGCLFFNGCVRFPHASFFHANSKSQLAYVGSNKEIRQAIIICEKDGSGCRLVTTCPDRITYLRWSPDGERLAYATEESSLGYSELFVIDCSGNAKKRLARFEAESTRSNR